MSLINFVKNPMSANIREVVEAILGNNGGSFDFSECKELFSSVANELECNEIDFSIGFDGCDYRVIRVDEIDNIQCGELESDLYMLGCFNAWFLADILGLDTDTIQTLQDAEAFEGIGKMVLAMDKLQELQAAYSSSDGYGHHFNHYDGNEIETNNYYIFNNH